MSEPNYIQWLTLRNVRIVTNSTAVSWLKVQCLLFLLCSLNATKGLHLKKEVNIDHNKQLYTRLIWSFFGENSGKSQQDVSSGDLESLHQRLSNVNMSVYLWLRKSLESTKVMRKYHLGTMNVTAVSSKTDELLLCPLCFSYCSSYVHYLKYLYITLMERKHYSVH